MFAKLAKRSKVAANHPSRQDKSSQDEELVLSVKRKARSPGISAEENLIDNSDLRKEGRRGKKRNTRVGDSLVEPAHAPTAHEPEPPHEPEPQIEFVQSSEPRASSEPTEPISQPQSLLNFESQVLIHAADMTTKGAYVFPSPFEVQLPNQLERYVAWRPAKSDNFDPLGDLRKVVEFAAQLLPPDAALKLRDPQGGASVLRRLNKALRAHDESAFLAAVSEFNELARQYRPDMRYVRPLPPAVSHELLSMAYARVVSPQTHLLEDYKSFSNNVYGELLPRFCTRIFKQTGLRDNQLFVDLGSGVGNVVLQAALEVGCEALGCEIMMPAGELAQQQDKELQARAKAWGLPMGATTLIVDDFCENTEVYKALCRAAVVLVNNYMFDGVLNNRLQQMFLDLQDGAYVVSLKPFGKESGFLFATQHEFGRDSVSWAFEGGKYYISQVRR